MDIGLKVYERAPPGVQHALTTLRGAQLRQKRYTSLTWRTLETLEASQWWDLARFESLQSEQLERLVHHAYRSVPLFRRKMEAAKLTPSDIRGLPDLTKLPLLSKAEFREHNDDLVVSRAFDRRDMWPGFTAGTSGTPLRAFFTHQDMQVRIAHLERFYRWYNPKRWRRRASFTGKLIVNPGRPTRTVSRANRMLNQWLFSSHHLSETELPLYIADLERIAPEQVDGILSPMFVVAQHLNRSGDAGRIQPKVIFPTSETLWEHMRETLSTAFAAPVANQYGSQEGAPMAAQCPQGGFHIAPESGIFEILELDGSGPCPPGKVGRLVVTSFVVHGTPLIRYDIGDLAAWAEGECTCGRQMPMLASVHGRAEDLFYTTTRGIVPKVDSAFKGMPTAIHATQVAQIGLDHFEVRMVVDDDAYRPEYGDRFADNLRKYLGDVRIEIKKLDQIPVTKGGKVRAQVNECRDLDAFKEIRNAWDSRNQQ